MHLHDAVELAIVKGFQGLGMDADVAQHEFRAQKANLEAGEVAQAGEEECLGDVCQNKANASLGFGQFRHVELAADLVQGQKAPVDAAAGAVDSHFHTVQGTDGVNALNADDSRDAQFAGGDGCVGGVAAHIGHDGRGNAHAWHHIGVRALCCQNVALVDLVKLKGGTQEADSAMACAAGGTVALEQDLGLGCGLLIHLAAVHEDGVGVLFELVVPAGFRTGLHEPQLVLGVDAELRVHDDAAVGLAHCAHAACNSGGLGQGQGPAQGFQFRNLFLAGATALVVDNAHVLAAHLADDDFLSVIPGKHVQLVRGHLAAHDCLAEAIACVDGDKILAVRAAAARGCVRSKGRTGDNGIDHLHDADGKRCALDGPFLLCGLANALVAELVGLGNGVGNGFAAVGHGAQVVGGSAVPVVGFGNVVRADHVEIGVLQAGEGLLARVLACSGGTHCNRHHLVLVGVADGLVGAAHCRVDLGRKRSGEDGCLHHDGTLAQLVNAFGGGCKAFDHIVDEGAQFGGAGILLLGYGLADLLAQATDQFLQIVGVTVDNRIVPVDAAVLTVHNSADKTAVDLAFVQNTMEGHRGNGPEVRSLDLLDLADDGGVVVLAADKQFGTFPELNNIRSCQYQLLSNGLRRRSSLGGLRLRGRLFDHDFLRIMEHVACDIWQAMQCACPFAMQSIPVQRRRARWRFEKAGKKT